MNTKRKPKTKRSTTKNKATLLLKKAGIMNSRARCQCLATCVRIPLEGEAFCRIHMNNCKRVAPLSGWEPPYEPERWNFEKAIRLTHNCFSYGMNMIDSKQIFSYFKTPDHDVPWHQPGSASRYPKFNDKDPKTCPNMIVRIMGDIPSIQPSAFELKCPEGSSKFALIVDEDEDYHFLRQDNTGYFSQKSGSLAVTDKDASGHKIFDVQLADHNFTRPRGKLHYDRFCGYFCVPRNKPLNLKVGGGSLLRLRGDRRQA